MTYIGRNQDGVGFCADSARVQWAVVEDIDTLNLSKQLETLQTSRLLDITGNFTSLSSCTIELRGCGSMCGGHAGGRGESTESYSGLRPDGRARRNGRNTHSGFEHRLNKVGGHGVGQR